MKNFDWKSPTYPLEFLTATRPADCEIDPGTMIYDADDEDGKRQWTYSAVERIDNERT